MIRIFMGSIGFIFCTFFVLGCGPSNFQDFVGKVKDQCLVTDRTTPIPLMAPEPCRLVLASLVPFDSSFDIPDPVHGDQKSRVINALYFLLNHPTAVPLDKKIFGYTEASHFISRTIQVMMLEHPELPLNQILFNYVLSAAHTFKLNNLRSDSSHYDPLDQGIHVSPDQVEDTFDRIYHLTSTLLHEARHSETLDHTEYCPKLSTLANECDQGTDDPVGWEASYAWALLRGNEIYPLTPEEMANITLAFFIKVSYLYALPEEARALRDFMPLGGPPALVLEHLTPGYPLDVYASVSDSCLKDRPIDNGCMKSIQALLPSGVLLLPKTTQDYFVHLLFTLLTTKFSAKDSMLHLGLVDDFLRDDIAYILRFRGMNVNQWLFDLTIAAIQNDYALQVLLDAPRPLTPNLGFPVSLQAAELIDLQKNILPYVFDAQLCVLYRSGCDRLLEIEHVRRLEFVFLWALLHGQLSMPANQRTLSSNEIEIFTQALCEQAKSVGRYIALPEVFVQIPNLSCEAIHERL